MGLQQDEQRTGRRLVRWAGGRRDRRAVHGGAAPRLADGGNAGAVPSLRGQDPGMGEVCAEPPLGGDLRRSLLSGISVRCRHRRDDPGSPAHGILDRKLRVVSENAATGEEWLKFATYAVQSTYGYEYQGDNLLLARVNLLLTYAEHLQARWQRKPTKEEL